MTNEERKSLDPTSREWYNRVAGSKIQIIGWSLYVAILWLVKFSLAIFYSRLTYDSHRPFGHARRENSADHTAERVFKVYPHVSESPM